MQRILEDTLWGVRAAPEGPNVRDSGYVSGVTYEAVTSDALRVNTMPKLEIERCGALLFSLSLKEAGIEKAHVEARERPGTQRR